MVWTEAAPDAEAVIVALLNRTGLEPGVTGHAAAGHVALHALVGDRVSTELERFDDEDDGEIRYKNLQPAIVIEIGGEGRDPELPRWVYTVTCTCLGGTVDGEEGSEWEPQKPGAVYRALSEVMRWNSNVRFDDGIFVQASEASVEVTDADVALGWPFKKASWTVEFHPA